MRTLLIIIFLCLPVSVNAELWVCAGGNGEISKAVRGDCLKMGLCSGFDNTGLSAGCVNATKEEFDLATKADRKVDTALTVGSRVVPLTVDELNTKYFASSYLDKLKAIDSKTQSLINSGFVYATKAFSLDPEARGDWTGLYVARDFLTYPLNIFASDGATYVLADAAEVQTFYLIGLATVQAAYDSGRTLIDATKACATLACLDTVVDSR